MKVPYKKRHLNTHLLYSLFFVITGFITLKEQQNQWYTVFAILAPIMFVSKYFYLKHTKYLTINKKVIKNNSLFGRQVNLSKIKQIEKYAGKYIIKTDKKKLTIDTHVIETKSLVQLNAALENLNVHWV
ncbi:hypothetical protein ES044_06250 [Polaribacter sp. IC066]|nr:hypothetical protein ES043_06215 [Polaribacter sp. IC063]TXD60973.1 hypothetical protein ES044_06250 [Polaribacter sp. IC066]